MELPSTEAGRTAVEQLRRVRNLIYDDIEMFMNIQREISSRPSDNQVWSLEEKCRLEVLIWKLLSKRYSKL